MFGKGSFSWYNLIFWYILLIEMTYCGFYFKANTLTTYFTGHITWMGALKCLLLYRLLHVGTFLVSTYFKIKLPNRVYEASNFFLHHVIVITLLLRSSAIKVAADHRIRRAIVFYGRPYYKASIDLRQV